MLPFLVRTIFFPLQEKIKGHKSFQCLSELEKSQWHSPDQMRDLQLAKLKALFAHAYANVPYYRKLWDGIGLLPQDVKSLEDLQTVPFLTKDIIRAHMEDLTARNTREKLIRFNTGGSTGAPLIFYIDSRRVSYDIAAAFRAKRWWGIDIGEREVVFWGSPVEVGRQDWVRELRDRLLNTKLVSAFDMDERTMRAAAQYISRRRPAHLFGYPSSIALFCKFVQAGGLDLTRAGVRVAFVTAEVLYPHQKEMIEKTFGCRVANGYGGRDSGFIAHECPQGGMHVTAENILLEFTDGSPYARGDRSGEIVVTHLDAYGMPFIRYKTGDIGAPSYALCSCGRGLPLMKVIEGRTTDFIITPAGKVMHSLSLIYVLRGIEGIDEFKIIQKTKDHLVVKIVRNCRYQSASSERIKRELQERMGAPVVVTLEFVDRIEAEKSGKFRYVVSEVIHAYDSTPPNEA